MAKNIVLAINPTSKPNPEVFLFISPLKYRKRIQARSFSEDLLPAIIRLLHSHSLKFSNIEGICVILGKGSSTSARTAVATANVLHFLLKIPLFCGKDDNILQKPEKLLSLNYKKGLIKPFYEHPVYFSAPNSKKFLNF